VPLPKGIDTCISQVILFFSFPLAFDCLLKVVCSFLFFSFFSVLSMDSSRGRLRVCVVQGMVDGRFLV
jgi:hypothetical protein